MANHEYVIGANLHSLIRSRQVDGLKIKSGPYWKIPNYNSIQHNSKEEESSEPPSISSSPSSSPSKYFPCPIRNGDAIEPIMSNCSSFISKLQIHAKLKQHNGCVNTIDWNEDGSKIITGSDDTYLKIWNGSPSYSVIHSIRTGHSRNIFSARFVPESNDAKMISCGMDGEVRLTTLDESGKATSTILGDFNHMIYKIFFPPGYPSSVFVTTQQDGTIRMYDLRESIGGGGIAEGSPSLHKKILIKMNNGSRSYSANSLAFDPLGGHQFVVGGSSNEIKLFDIRYLVMNQNGANDGKGQIGRFCPQSILDNKKVGVSITGVDYNRQNEIVATYSKEDVFLFNLGDLTSEEYLKEDSFVNKPRQIYTGRTNVATFLKEVCFMDGGFSRNSVSSYVATGSDCGNVFIWEKHTGELVQLIKGDHSIVNGLAPHPFLPHLAVCGIDSYAKILEPSSETPTFDPLRAKDTMNRNINDSDDDEDDSFNEFNMFQLLIQALRARADPERQQRNEREIAMLNESETIRASANQLFRNGDARGALTKYREALDVLVPSVFENARMSESRLHCYNNQAACYLQLEEWNNAIQACNEALDIDPNSHKALFRRAQARVGLGQDREAYFDLKRAIRHSPEEYVAQVQTLKDAIVQKHPDFLQLPSESEEEDEEMDE
eukprot:TRINITY_DN2361_c0_g1_i1.p1 TRINITY_DN2361_c0_g1~~TRINITY_DN2361_c0_g1_i1.p1  ORF type:complete len:663 (+),score=193.88 TRINITY_DN2361_c0_g1_i1:64-2052(+)